MKTKNIISTYCQIEGNELIGEFLKSNHPFLASKVPNLVCYMADHFLLRNEPIPDHLKKQALVG